MRLTKNLISPLAFPLFPVFVSASVLPSPRCLGQTPFTLSARRETLFLIPEHVPPKPSYRWDRGARVTVLALSIVPGAVLSILIGGVRWSKQR